jgi:site-specific DNA-methyltransferase (adenine-specific)
MKFMAQIPDKSFDLAIVDPPYFDGPNKSGYYGKGYSSLGVQRAKHYDSLDSWSVPEKEYFDELKRVSKNQIIWGANYFAEKFESSSSCWIVWDKDNGKSSFADCELAYTSFKSAARLFKYTWNGMHQGSYGGDVRKNEPRIHPTQKPTTLYSWLLENYAKPGQKILDTHLGSASSAIAAYYFGCEFVGTEIDVAMHAAATKRFEMATAQQDLFQHNNYTNFANS